MAERAVKEARQELFEAMDTKDIATIEAALMRSIAALDTDALEYMLQGCS